MLQSRQPITDAYIKDFMAQPAKPLVSGAGEHRRDMSASIMGEWLRARPGVTDEDIRKEFTRTERERFLPEAIDYAIRRSGNAH